MNDSLDELIVQSRLLMQEPDLSRCKRLICQAMSDYPDNAIPHNLMGLLCEKQGNHIGAMKHFRAACALDPSYRPAFVNLDYFGSDLVDKPIR